MPSNEASQNATTVSQFLAALGSPDIERITSFMREDLTWIIPQDPKYSKLAGTRDLQQWIRLYRGFLSKVPSGARYEIIGITAEGDRVAAEVESFADTPAGPFHNRYHFLFVLEDGRLKIAKEYADSLFMYKFQRPSIDLLVRLWRARSRNKRRGTA